MNDFTREELEWLLETVDYCIEGFYEQNPAYSVQSKLKTLIYRYCEHEKSGIEHIECMEVCAKCSTPY